MQWTLNSFGTVVTSYLAMVSMKIEPGVTMDLQLRYEHCKLSPVTVKVELGFII